jgi:NADH-ubiquinone oxidoreductase chain 1
MENDPQSNEIRHVADALKLILKETVIPSQSNKILFILAPVFTLIVSLLG